MLRLARPALVAVLLSALAACGDDGPAVTDDLELDVATVDAALAAVGSPAIAYRGFPHASSAGVTWRFIDPDPCAASTRSP